MQKRLLCVVTGGSGGLDEARARLLCGAVERDSGAQISYEFADRKQSRRDFSARVEARLRESFDLVHMEGTGIAAGWPLIQAARRGQKFLVSGGDPISGYVKVKSGALQAGVFGEYERRLMRACTGFVGWTPYLAGRALQLGARRAITVEGGADLQVFRPPTPAEKARARQKLRLAPDHLVCVVVGSLNWNPRHNYAYGLELIEALHFLKRRDVSMLIVGDGDGKAVLEARLNAQNRASVRFTGRLPQSEVVSTLHAADIGFVTQTLDGLGNYRLTTKLPEYLATGLGVAMSPIPGFYDYVFDAGWALPPLHPASAEFHRGSAALLDSLSRDDIAEKSARAVEIAAQRFDNAALSARFSRFVSDIW